MKVSNVLSSNNIKLLFFVFFNLGSNSDDQKYEFKIAYRKSKKASMELTEDIVKKNNILMSNYTGLEFEYSGQTHKYELENDLGLDRVTFLNEVYKKIQKSRFNNSVDKFEEALYMGLFAFRGSIDMNRRLYAVDLLNANVSSDYINHLTSLLISSDGVKQLNLNFRELQPEYVKNVSRRNTQVRINLKWFYEKYIDSIKKINIYKHGILKDNEAEIIVGNISNTVNNNFIERLLFYKDKIIGSTIDFNKLSESQLEQEIDKLRDALDFESQQDVDNSDDTRNQSIVQLARAYLPNECVACKDDYNLLDRTFLRRDSDQPYLEIHHVISFGSGNNSDVLENLVKLCPACHRALTPNRADVSYQKKLISNIINNSVVVNEYLDNFLNDTADVKDKIDFVYNNLR